LRVVAVVAVVDAQDQSMEPELVVAPTAANVE
jgi:hypothetical protein